MKTTREILTDYLPAGSVDMVIRLVEEYRFQLRITKARRTKLGDYRPPVKKGFHRISVNHNLNPYLFLITLVHEIAHLVVWNQYKNRVKPHGKEWKRVFKELMSQFINDGIFPEDIELPLISYLRNSKASSVSDQKLTRALRKYDDQNFKTLEQLHYGKVFKLPDGRSFIRLEKLRTRYRCQSLNNKRFYLINALTEVVEAVVSD